MNQTARALPASSTSWGQVSLGRIFWLAAFILVSVVVLTAHPQYIQSVVGAGCIIITALLPAWLWMSGRVVGLPLFPVYAATFIGTYALPLLYEHPIVSLFPADNQLIGAFTVTGFLLFGSVAWFFVARRLSAPLGACLLLSPVAADIFFLCALGGGVVFNLADNAGWLNIDPGVFTIIRAVTVALEALGCFTLAFRLGSGDLNASKALLFKILLAGLILSELPTLLLIGPMAIVVITTLAYTLGARRFPWLAVVMSVLAFAFLHAGKGDMRNMYWEEEEDPILQPQLYPSFFVNWFRTSVGNISAGKSEKGEEEQTLLERASLMQLLLYEQGMTPNEVPYMYGETYAIIPALLIPRIFNPTKMASHEGTYRLNIHYGFQTREQTAHNTVGFGLLNEAFANFGYVGVGLLALVLGVYYGAVARWAHRAPVLSFRSLFAIIVASYAFQTEFAAGVYVSALFQSTCALLILTALFMRRAPIAGGAAPAVTSPLNVWQRAH